MVLARSVSKTDSKQKLKQLGYSFHFGHAQRILSNILVHAASRHPASWGTDGSEYADF